VNGYAAANKDTVTASMISDILVFPPAQMINGMLTSANYLNLFTDPLPDMFTIVDPANVFPDLYLISASTSN
jgi:hypothetical protein